jgi:MFS family permease
MPQTAANASEKGLWLAVLAAALGYFVDLYDIVLFGVVRVASLADLGLTGEVATVWGIRLLNLQMLGMLIGGFFWGGIGDTRGRRTALFASIATYSLANLANAGVESVEAYAVLRFIAGLGLAGELGAGIALISELLGPKRRGYGATVVAVLGLLGALAAALTGSQLPWRWAYTVGGVLGLLVLCLRWVSRHESPMFTALESSSSRSLRALLADSGCRRRFVLVTLLGVPIWVFSALFVNLAPEFGNALGFTAPLKVGQVLLWQAVGSAIGMAAFGVLSEQLQSRRKALYLALLLLAGLLPLLLSSGSVAAWCWAMALVGVAQGYWTLLVLIAAEQFPTAMRATTASAIPNVVRGFTIPVTLSVQALATSLGWIGAAALVATIALIAALLALGKLPETYGQSLATAPAR